MCDVVTAMQTFVRVVEAGSFTAVAEERNTSQPTISRQIAQLEDHLGSLLFQRSTRALSLTEDGHVFYNHALRTIETMSEAETAVGRRKTKPSGMLRVTCTTSLARLQIIPRLQRFMNQYPDVGIDFTISDKHVDIVAEGIDLAIRAGDVGDEALIARRMGSVHFQLVGAPCYLDDRGRPESPDDLKKHDCIVYTGAESGWSFAHAQGRITLHPQGRLRFNNVDAVREAVLSGLGLGLLPLWHLTKDVMTSGQIEILLPGYKAAPIPVNILYSTRRHLAPKTRAAIDFLVSEFEGDPLFTGVIA